MSRFDLTNWRFAGLSTNPNAPPESQGGKYDEIYTPDLYHTIKGMCYLLAALGCGPRVSGCHRMCSIRVDSCLFSVLVHTSDFLRQIIPPHEVYRVLYGKTRDGAITNV